MRKDRIDKQRVRRAAVVEESVMQRARSVQLLQGELGLEVVHFCSSLRSFLAWMQNTDRMRWPHLLVLDLPSEDDAPRQLDLLAALRDAGMRVLILSTLRARHLARRVISRGVDGIVSTTCDKTSGTTFPVGTTTVTCSASDAAGNVSNASFSVAVSPLAVGPSISPGAAGGVTPPPTSAWGSAY